MGERSLAWTWFLLYLLAVMFLASRPERNGDEGLSWEKACSDPERALLVEPDCDGNWTRGNWTR